jgi:catechol 2,3-dioxygenase-like lactoylglutathione lyase family enzyme
MSSTEISNQQKSRITHASPVDTKLEVVVIPVTDVDRAKRFYANLGWRVDADFVNGEDWRVVQVTPPGSPCSIIFGKGVTSAVPGSVQGLFLVVDDVDAARAELRSHGADVSDVFHFDGGLAVTGTKGRARGRDPEGHSYRTWASFSDPDGNGGCFKKSRLGFPAAASAATSQLLQSFCERPNSATENMKRALRSTTGPDGTPATSLRGNVAGRPRKQATMLRLRCKRAADCEPICILPH